MITRDTEWSVANLSGLTMSATSSAAETYTRRQYLMYRLIMDGTPAVAATEAVTSTAAEHPEWDMDEEHTFAEWEETE